MFFRVKTFHGLAVLGACFALAVLLIRFSSDNFNRFLSLSFSENSNPRSQLAQVADVTNGLVGHWSFDEGSGTTAADSSGNGNNGTLVNGPAWVAGKIGGAVSFNGSTSEKIQLGGPSLSNTFTVSLWVNPSSGTNAYSPLVAQSGSLGIYYRQNYHYVSYFFNDPSQGNNDHFCYSAVAENSWNHLALVNNAGSATLYLNGNSCGSFSGAPAMNVAFIGNDAYSGDASLTGSIDDVRAYNRALSASEVSALYAPSAAASAPSNSPQGSSSGSSSAGSGGSSSAPAANPPPASQNPIIPPPSATPPAGSSATDVSGTASSISQYGVTWQFDKAYSYGQFANGDYWVQGPVVITRMTPDFDGAHNGWEVNPMPSAGQSFDAGSYYFSAAGMPSLPYTALPDQSIVKAVSISQNPADTANCSKKSGAYTCLETAAVLTVVAAPPPGGGADVFRPPYVGTAKPYYHVSDLQTQLLPSLAPVSSTPSIADLTGKFQRVQMEHVWGFAAGTTRPRQNLPYYGGHIAENTNDAALRLMLSDPIQDKMPLLIAYAQGGIDRYYAMINGMKWPGGTGHEPGQKINIAFTAVMLGDQAMQNAVSKTASENFFNEDNGVQIGYGGQALWGFSSENYGEANYWDAVKNDPGYNLSKPDPYGFVDGGITDKRAKDDYQTCCTSGPWKASALAGVLMPQIKTLWNNPAFYSYVDRFVTVGVWSEPDPCAPTSRGGGPDGKGGCILDPNLTVGSTMQNFSCQQGKVCGRFPGSHGIFANQVAYVTPFQTDMWNAYRKIAGTLPMTTVSSPPSQRTSATSNVPPAISSVSASIITPSSATISWSTDVTAADQVEYGLTTAYGNVSTLNSTLALSHSVTLSNLSPNTVYHYRVKSKDGAGNTTASTDYTFTTAPVSPAASSNSASSGGGGQSVSSGGTSSGGGSSNTGGSSSRGGSSGGGGGGISSGGGSSNGGSQSVSSGEGGLSSGTSANQGSSSSGGGFSSSGGGSSSSGGFSGGGSSVSGGGSVTAAQSTDHSLSQTKTITIPTTLLSIPYGTRSSSVITLQNSLISQGYLARGLNTGYYGPLTKAAIAKYQADVTKATPITTPTASYRFTRSLTTGSTGPDVKALQQFLNSSGFTVSKTGPGSPGNETSYFGPATRSALIRYQEANADAILTPNRLTRGTGYFGLSTMRAVNSSI